MPKEDMLNNGSSSSDLKKISMNLTVQDIENSLYLKNKLNERNQASVISRSMSVLSELAKMKEENPDYTLAFVDKNGNMDKIKILGLF